jgi:hypothetical protein
MAKIMYMLAGSCAMFALALLLHPIFTNLDNLRDGIGALLTLGLVNSVAPLAIALAVIPLCIAIAFDRMSD